MSNDPVQRAVDADDLLGRWFAHHDKAAADDDGTATPPRRVPIAARPSEAAAPRATRPSASAALAELRHAEEAPPSTSGVRRGLPGSAHSGPTGGARRAPEGEVAELDRPSPVGF